MAPEAGKFKVLHQLGGSPATDGMASPCDYGTPFAVPRSSTEERNFVDNWLVNAGYGRYRPCFRKHGITEKSLLALTLTDLKAMGVRDNDDVAGILGNIAKLKLQYGQIDLEECPSFRQHRSLCFGLQPTMEWWLTSASNPGRAVFGQPSVRATHLPDTITLTRIRNQGGDLSGWFRLNRPNPLI